MSSGTVASACVEWNGVIKAVNSVFDGGPFILLSEDSLPTNPPHFELITTLDTAAPNPRGRAFDQSREVRWREIKIGRYVVTYLSETVPPPAEAGLILEQSEWETRNAVQKLYGTRSAIANDWVEVSVPGINQKYSNLVNHPKPPTALQIAAVDYSRDGIVQMTRFCAVGAYEEH